MCHSISRGRAVPPRYRLLLCAKPRQPRAHEPETRWVGGKIPAGEHLLVAAPDWKPNVTEWTKGRRVTSLGHYPPQDIDYYYVAAAGARP